MKNIDEKQLVWQEASNMQWTRYSCTKDVCNQNEQKNLQLISPTIGSYGFLFSFLSINKKSCRRKR